MIALNSSNYVRPGRISVAVIVAKLKGLLLGPDAEPAPMTPHDRSQVRDEAGRALAEVNRAWLVEERALSDALAKAQARLEKVAPGYHAALAAMQQADLDLDRRRQDIAYERERLRRQIQVAADPILGETISDLIELMDENRRTLMEEDERLGEVMPGGYVVVEAWSNAPSIEAGRVAIRAAIDTLEEAKSDPDQVNIRDRILAMVESLPDPNELVKIRTFERKLPPEVERVKIPRFINA